MNSLLPPFTGAANEINGLKVLYSELIDADEDDAVTLKNTGSSEENPRILTGELRRLHLAIHGFIASTENASALSQHSS